MTSSPASPPPAHVYDSLRLDRVFDHTGFAYDLVAGTVHNPGRNRVIYLNEDLVRGIHRALVNETGPAWKSILHLCGLRWGRRLGERLDAELKLVGRTQMGKLPLADFLKLIETYFAAHGWGRLEIDVTHTSERGVVACQLGDSFFSHALKGVDEHVDSLVAGTLAGLFGYVSGNELGCVETASANRGAPAGRFLISSRTRTDALMPLVEQGLDADELHRRLLA
jgi:uncharacterized protein